MEQRQAGGITERPKPSREDFEGFARERRLRALPGHGQRPGPVGAAHVGIAPPPAAHTAAGPAGETGGSRFQGILSRTSARPHVPVAPANVSPAPKNAAITRNHGLTNTPRATPVSTMVPAISWT